MTTVWLPAGCGSLHLTPISATGTACGPSTSTRLTEGGPLSRGIALRKAVGDHPSGSPLTAPRVNFLELRKAEVHVQSPLPIAISSTTSLLCLNDFDALPLLGSTGEDGVYLQSQEHHKTLHVEPEHEDYHRTELAVDLPVVTQLRDVVAQSAIS